MHLGNPIVLGTNPMTLTMHLGKTLILIFILNLIILVSSYTLAQESKPPRRKITLELRKELLARISIPQNLDEELVEVTSVNDIETEEVFGEVKLDSFKVENMIEIHNEEVQVEQVILDNISLEPLRVDTVNVVKEEEVLTEKVVQVDNYHVESEFIDFLFAPNNIELSDKEKLLDVLPTTFSSNTCFRSCNVCIHTTFIQS
ncbi:hypothetical protein GOBAR_DD11248 [Gossypium barbadense]|nr:hypothetical protein GOBAR_DD11248 [Gossypium barbadense]